MIGLIGKKLGQTRVYDTTATPCASPWCTAGPNPCWGKESMKQMATTPCNSVTMIKPSERQPKPLRGHFEKQGGKSVKQVKEFRDYSLEVNTGDEV